MNIFKTILSLIISLFPLAILLFTNVFTSTTGLVILSAIAAVANFVALSFAKLNSQQLIIAYVAYLVVMLGFISLF